MKREWRVLSRLWRHYDRAPRAYLFCDDPAVLGADFFVMERRRGVVVRGEIPAAMARMPTRAAARASRSSTPWPSCTRSTPVACGLGDLGKPDGFVARQVSGWAKRWELARRDDATAEMERDPRAPRRARARAERVSIVHNDLKLDNCAFDPAIPTA